MDSRDGGHDGIRYNLKIFQIILPHGLEEGNQP